MTDAEALRAEIRHLRSLASFIVDPLARGEIEAMIAELESRARHAENSGSTDAAFWRGPGIPPSRVAH
jgi:hypothetical protein